MNGSLCLWYRCRDVCCVCVKVLNVSDDMISGMFRTLAAILWIGNLQFQDTESEACKLTREDEKVVKKVAKLLGLPEAQVRKVCTIRQISVRGTTTDIALKYAEVSVIMCNGVCMYHVMVCRLVRTDTPCPKLCIPGHSAGLSIRSTPALTLAPTPPDS